MGRSASRGPRRARLPFLPLRSPLFQPGPAAPSRWERLATAWRGTVAFMIEPLEQRILLAGDLQLISAAISSPTKAGTPVTVTWTVKNVGDAPVQGTWYDAMYLSDDNQLDAQYGGAPPPSVAAVSLPETVGAPAVTRTSLYEGMAVVGGGLRPETWPLANGTPVVHDAQGQSDVRITAFAESPIGGLAPGASYTDTQQIVLPARYGDEYLIVQANAFNYSGMTEADVTNNLFALPVTIVPPDVNLQASNLSLPAGTQVEGSQITLTWTDTNT